MAEMSIREARQYAHMTQKDVSQEYDIPIRTLQNWESEDREPPKYVEEWLVQELIQTVRVATIKYTENHNILNKRNGTNELRKGFECWLTDTDNPDEDDIFAWFIPVDDKGMIHFTIMEKIRDLKLNGWKIMFNF